jgi:hypothetical protein
MPFEMGEGLGRWLNSRFLTGLSARFGMTRVRVGVRFGTTSVGVGPWFGMTSVRVGVLFGMTRVGLGQTAR